MSIIFKFLRRLAIPGGVPQGVAAIGSLIVMVAIFIADVLTDDTIQMHLLYVFPLILVCFHCKQRWLIRAAVSTSILLQGFTLISYGSALPILSKLILASLILPTNILIAYITTSAIQYAADLSASQAKLHGILDYSPICIWFSGIDGRYQYVNKAFCNAFGKSEQQLIFRRPSEVFDGESSLDLSKTQQFSLINEIPQHTRETLTFADGKPHLFEITRVMLVDGKGENSGTIGIMNDITEASALQKALKKSHDELETRVSERTQDLKATANKLVLEMQARKKLERRFLEVSEETQAQIGRELHDDLGQLLTGVAYLAGSLASRLTKLDQEACKQAETIKNITQDAIKRTRYITHGLIPFNISSQGLKQALEQLAEDVLIASGIPCEIHWSGANEITDFMIATNLYRITQEAINNAVKHSAASHLSIKLIADANEICLTIADDGVGLPGNTQSTTTGVGILNMKHRAHLIGASITVDSNEEHGTCVSLTVPVAIP